MDAITVSGNEINNNSKDGVKFVGSFAGAPEFKVNNNSITASGNNGVKNEVANTVNAANNWRGDASGPYNAAENPSGTGDSVSNNVMISPWLATQP